MVFSLVPTTVRVIAAGVPVKCNLAHAVGPAINNVVGQLEGLALYVGPVLAIGLAAMLVLLAMHKIRGKLAIAVVFILGAMVALSLVGGIFGAVVHNPC